MLPFQFIPLHDSLAHEFVTQTSKFEVQLSTPRRFLQDQGFDGHLLEYLRIENAGAPVSFCAPFVQSVKQSESDPRPYGSPLDVSTAASYTEFLLQNLTEDLSVANAPANISGFGKPGLSGAATWIDGRNAITAPLFVTTDIRPGSPEAGPLSGKFLEDIVDCLGIGFSPPKGKDEVDLVLQQLAEANTAFVLDAMRSGLGNMKAAMKAGPRIPMRDYDEYREIIKKCVEAVLDCLASGAYPVEDAAVDQVYSWCLNQLHLLRDGHLYSTRNFRILSLKPSADLLDEFVANLETQQDQPMPFNPKGFIQSCATALADARVPGFDADVNRSTPPVACVNFQKGYVQFRGTDRAHLSSISLSKNDPTETRHPFLVIVPIPPKLLAEWRDRAQFMVDEFHLKTGEELNPDYMQYQLISFPRKSASPRATDRSAPHFCVRSYSFELYSADYFEAMRKRGIELVRSYQNQRTKDFIDAELLDLRDRFKDCFPVTNKTELVQLLKIMTIACAPNRLGIVLDRFKRDLYKMDL